MRPRRAQEGHTHAGAEGLLVARPDIFITPLTTVGSTPVTTGTAVWPSSPSTEKGIDSIGSFTSSLYSGSLATRDQYRYFSLEDAGRYSRATGFQFRTMVAVKDLGDDHTGWVGLHRRDSEDRAWMAPPWTDDGGAPSETEWDPGAGAIMGDGTYWSDVSFYEDGTDTGDWHMVYTRPTGNKGQRVMALLADGTALMVWTTGNATAYGSVDVALCDAGEQATIVARGNVTGWVCWVEKTPFTPEASVSNAASNVGLWLATIQADTTNYAVTVADGVGPVPEPFPLSSFIGARFNEKGSGARYWEFHSHSAKNSSYSYSAYRGEGVSVATSIPVVSGNVYSLSARCEAGSASATFRLTDTSDGAYEEWVADWATLGWSTSSWLWSAVAGARNEAAGANKLHVVEHQGFTSPWSAGVAFAP